MSTEILLPRELSPAVVEMLNNGLEVPNYLLKYINKTSTHFHGREVQVQILGDHFRDGQKIEDVRRFCVVVIEIWPTEWEDFWLRVRRRELKYLRGIKRKV